MHHWIDRVQRIRPIERDRGDAVGLIDFERFVFAVICHANTPPIARSIHPQTRPVIASAMSRRQPKRVYSARVPFFHPQKTPEIAEVWPILAIFREYSALLPAC